MWVSPSTCQLSFPSPPGRPARASSSFRARPTVSIRRVGPQEELEITSRRLTGEATKVNREIRELSEMQMVYRFVRSRRSRKRGNPVLYFPIRSQSPRPCGLFPCEGTPRARLSPALRRLHRNYERFGPEYERIGTGVRTNRYRSTNESGRARSVEDRENRRPQCEAIGKSPRVAPRTRPQRRSEGLRHADTKYEIGTAPSFFRSCRPSQGAWPGVSGRLASFYCPSSRFFRRWRRYISARGSSTCYSCSMPSALASFLM